MENSELEKLQYPIGKFISPEEYTSEYIKKKIAEINSFPERLQKEVINMLRSGRWWRGSGEAVADFEKKYAELMGAKRCLATASGTTALLVALQVLGVDAGDEVLVSPYTFIATYNSNKLFTASLPNKSKAGFSNSSCTLTKQLTDSLPSIT